MSAENLKNSRTLLLDIIWHLIAFAGLYVMNESLRQFLGVTFLDENRPILDSILWFVIFILLAWVFFTQICRSTELWPVPSAEIRHNFRELLRLLYALFLSTSVMMTAWFLYLKIMHPEAVPSGIGFIIFLVVDLVIVYVLWRSFRMYSKGVNESAETHSLDEQGAYRKQQAQILEKLNSRLSDNEKRLLGRLQFQQKKIETVNIFSVANFFWAVLLGGLFKEIAEVIFSTIALGG